MGKRIATHILMRFTESSSSNHDGPKNPFVMGQDAGVHTYKLSVWQGLLASGDED